MIGRPPFGCAGAGWLEMSNADAVTSAIARDESIAKRDVFIAKRDAGIARPALLGLSRPNIRNPVFAALLQAVRGSLKIRRARRWGQRTPDHASRRYCESKACRLRRQRGSLTVCVHWR